MAIQFTKNIEQYTKTMRNESTKQTITSSIPRPSCTEVDKYLKRWKSDDNLLYSDIALKRLFTETYPKNISLCDIIAKAAALNSIYSTYIYSFYPIAKSILSLNVDERLRVGDETLVKDILSSFKQDGAMEHFSFATKYCSFHNQEAFPIYDKYVDEILWYFNGLEKFSKYRRGDIQEKHDYLKFKSVLRDFRSCFGLEKYSTKELDQFLWQFGKDYFSKKG